MRPIVLVLRARPAASAALSVAVVAFARTLVVPSASGALEDASSARVRLATEGTVSGDAPIAPLVGVLRPVSTTVLEVLFRAFPSVVPYGSKELFPYGEFATILAFTAPDTVLAHVALLSLRTTALSRTGAIAVLPLNRQRLDSADVRTLVKTDAFQTL